MTVLVSSQLSIPLNLMVDIVRADIYIFFHLSLLLRSQTVTSNSIIVFLLVLLPTLPPFEVVSENCFSSFTTNMEQISLPHTHTL